MCPCIRHYANYYNQLLINQYAVHQWARQCAAGASTWNDQCILYLLPTISGQPTQTAEGSSIVSDSTPLIECLFTWPSVLIIFTLDHHHLRSVMLRGNNAHDTINLHHCWDRLHSPRPLFLSRVSLVSLITSWSSPNSLAALRKKIFVVGLGNFSRAMFEQRLRIFCHVGYP